MEETKDKKCKPYLLIGIVALLAVFALLQGYRISKLTADVATLKSIGLSGISQSSSDAQATLQTILKEVTPTGTPDYGKSAGVSYDDVEAGITTLVGYHQGISLSGDKLERYIKIATTPETACEYCCGVGKNGFGTRSGQLACGCAHNIAFSGLTKWLLKNSDYTNEQIIGEIHKWKALFFPQATVEAELAKRNINPQSVGLPSMIGGC